MRGFITTPLERAIAAADGIDYIESQSAQGLSTITVRLKLNYDATKALADISSKVDQVRGDLPPEAEMPVINIESADTEFASAYLSFTSDILQPNEITDYLVRVVQPRLSAVEGVQRADILGGRTFAMRIWLKPDRMAALNISPAQVRKALAANNYLAAVGRTKGSLVQVNLTANTDLRSVEEFKKLVIREQDGTLVRLSDIADVVLGAEDYDTEVRFSGQKAVFMGIFPLPNANALDVIKRVRAEMDADPKGIADRPEGADRLRRHRLHQRRHPRSRQDADARHCSSWWSSSSCSSVRCARCWCRWSRFPISLIGGIFLMQVFGFTPQPADPAGDRAVGRTGGRRRHRRGRKRRAPHARRPDARSTPRFSARAN